MLVFPNCKINLGLHVTEKRLDGYHNIETVFYPVNWCDALEVMVDENEPAGKLNLVQSGLNIDGSTDDNLINKAWKLINSQHKLPSVKVHLHKVIPMGAGLGGGSADAAFFINTVNSVFNLNISFLQRQKMAASLGSDCAFFIGNNPVLAKGRGDLFSEIKVNLSAYYLLVVYPGIHSNTRNAYQGLVPKAPGGDLKKIIETETPENWKNLLVNDFETSIFKNYPAIAGLKAQLYNGGALYASMSGSGSAVYGIFKNEPDSTIFKGYAHCLQKPTGKIL